MKSGCKALILVTIVLLTIPFVQLAEAGVSDVSAPSGTTTVYQTFPLTLNFTATLSGGAPRAAVISSNIPEDWTYVDYEATFGGMPMTFIETVGATSVSWENETMGEGTMVLLAHFRAPYSLGNYAFSGAYAYRAGGALQPGTWGMTARVIEFPSGVDVIQFPAGEISRPPGVVSLGFEVNLTGLDCRAVVSSSIPENCTYLGYEAYLNGSGVTFSETVVGGGVTLENGTLGWSRSMNLRLALWLNFSQSGDYNVTGLYVFAGGKAIDYGNWSVLIHIVPIRIVNITVASMQYGSLIPIAFKVSSPGMAYPNTTVRISMEFEETLAWERNATFDFPAGNTTLMINYTLIADYCYEVGWDTLDLQPASLYKNGGNITVIVQLISPEGELLAENSTCFTLLPCTRECLWDRIVEIILEWPRRPECREAMWDDIVKIILLWPTVPEGKG